MDPRPSRPQLPHPPSAVLTPSIGGFGLRRGQYDEAIQNLDKAIALDPRASSGAYYLRGSIYELRSQYDKAIADLNKAAALSSHDASIYMTRGSAWVGLKEHHRAIEDFNRAIELSPEAEAFVARADARREIQEYHRALEDYERVISLNPDTHVYVGRGCTYLDVNDYDNAVDDFDKAIALDESNTDAHVRSGDAYRALGNHTKAIKAYTQAISLLPEMVDVHQEVFEMMDGDMQLEQYDNIIGIIGGVHLKRAGCYLHLGDSDKAIEDFDAAIKLMPGNVDYFCARATAHVEIGNHAKAMKDLETAAELDSLSANVPFIRAGYHFKRGELHRAMEDSTRAIELSPNRGDLYALRGRFRLHLGDHASAIVDLDRAIELDSSSLVTKSEPGVVVINLERSFAHVCRGLAHTLLGDNTAANRDFRKALESGYSQADIEAELAELTQDGKTRESVMTLVSNVTSAKRWGVTRQSQAPRSAGPASLGHKGAVRVGPRPQVTKQGTMNKEGYTDLFRGLGFYDIEVGKTLKHRKPIPSLYFNCRYGSVSFVGYEKDRHRYDSSLWNRIPPEKKKDDKPGRMTIVPKTGREREAFEELLLR